MGKKSSFYAVRKGVKPGIYTTWSEAESQVKGFQGAVHKKFNDLKSAESFLQGAALVQHASLAKKRLNDDDDAKGKKKARAQEQGDWGNRIVYCDGSSRGNGKKNAVAGIGVVWEKGVDAPNLSERLPGKLQTNNRAEMYAVARILESDPNPELPLTICSDSQYTISVFSQWIPAWRDRKWKTSTGSDVQNYDLIIYILTLLSQRPSSSSDGLASNIRFRKVKAHVGIEANEKADRLANEGAWKEVAKDRNFLKEAEALKKDKELKDIESIKFAVDIEEGDLLTEEELQELGERQEFD